MNAPEPVLKQCPNFAICGNSFKSTVAGPEYCSRQCKVSNSPRAEVPDDAALAGHSGQARHGRPPNADRRNSPAITVEEFLRSKLPKITKIAKEDYVESYDLPLKDCISAAELALFEAEAKAKRNGELLPVKVAWAIVRRAFFRFAERELKERGLTREDDPESPGTKKWVHLRHVVSMDDELYAENGRASHEDAVTLREFEVESIATPADNPEEQAIAKEREHQVKVAIQGLPPLQGKVLLLRYYKGLSVREAAFVLRMSKSEVWRISKEATAAIAKELGTKLEIAPTDIVEGAMRQSEQKLAA